jgi:hypothetical protein
MMRPHRAERLQGWKEYRTGGPFLRVTVSWDEPFEQDDHGPRDMAVPRMVDVLETLLVGSLNHEDDLSPSEECARYRSILRELNRRIDELEDCWR